MGYLDQYWVAFFAGCLIALFSLILLPILGYGRAIVEMAKTIERAAIPFLVGCALLFWLWQDKDQSVKIDRIDQTTNSTESRVSKLESLLLQKLERPERWDKLKNQIEEFQNQQSQPSQQPQ